MMARHCRHVPQLLNSSNPPPVDLSVAHLNPNRKAAFSSASLPGRTERLEVLVFPEELSFFGHSSEGS